MDEFVWGLGMRVGISQAGTDLVEPLLKRIKYCGDMVGSSGVSTMVPERWIMLLLELGSSTLVPGG